MSSLTCTRITFSTNESIVMQNCAITSLREIMLALDLQKQRNQKFRCPCCVKSMNPPLEWTQMLSSWEQSFTWLTRDALEIPLIVEPVSRRSHWLLIPSDWAWRQALSWVCPSPELPGALSNVPAVGQWFEKWPNLWQRQQVVVAHVHPSVPGTTLPSACCTKPLL